MIKTLVIYNFVLIASTFFVYIGERVKYDFDRRFFLFFGFIVVALPAAVRFNIPIRL